MRRRLRQLRRLMRKYWGSTIGIVIAVASLTFAFALSYSDKQTAMRQPVPTMIIPAGVNGVHQLCVGAINVPNRCHYE